MVGNLAPSSNAVNSFSDNHFKAVFTRGISDYLDEVERLEDTIGQDASVAEANCIIQPYHENAVARMLTLCSFTNGVRESSDAAGRYQHDNVTARTSNRQHTTKLRRYESTFKFF